MGILYRFAALEHLSGMGQTYGFLPGFFLLLYTFVLIASLKRKEFTMILHWNHKVNRVTESSSR